MRCPKCNMPVQDEGLCVSCYDAQVEHQSHRYDYNRDYRLTHVAHIRVYKETWRLAHTEHINRYKRAWRQARKVAT